MSKQNLLPNYLMKKEDQHALQLKATMYLYAKQLKIMVLHEIKIGTLAKGNYGKVRIYHLPLLLQCPSHMVKQTLEESLKNLSLFPHYTNWWLTTHGSTCVPSKDFMSLWTNSIAPNLVHYNVPECITKESITKEFFVSPMVQVLKAQEKIPKIMEERSAAVYPLLNTEEERKYHADIDTLPCIALKTTQDSSWSSWFARRKIPDTILEENKPKEQKSIVSFQAQESDTQESSLSEIEFMLKESKERNIELMDATSSKGKCGVRVLSANKKTSHYCTKGPKFHFSTQSHSYDLCTQHYHLLANN